MWRPAAALRRKHLRLVGTALLAALVATAVTTTERATTGEAAPDPGTSFPLSVSRPALGHVADEDLTIQLGQEEEELPVGADQPVRLDGIEGHSGMVQALDESGRLAGLTIAPKDDVALLGVHDEGPLEVPIDYRTTAFGIFATQPGLASPDPAVTVLLAALVTDLPEFDAFAGTLEADASQDPAYLEGPSDQAADDLGALLLAFQERTAEIEAALGDADPEPGTTTTVAFRSPTQAQADPDGCNPSVVENVIVVDTQRQDHVCLTEATFNGTAWEVKGKSSTPRWAIARPINAGVPAEQIGFVPGKALAIPELPGLALDLSLALAEGAFNELKNFGINVCNGLAWLVGKRCAAPGPNILQPFIDQVSSYFQDAPVDLVLDGSNEQTVLSINGLGMEGGEASGEDITSSVMITVAMTLIAPTIEIFVDLPLRRSVLRNLDPVFLKALEDTAAVLAPDIAALAEDIRTGSIVDRLGTVVSFAKRALSVALDEGLVEAVVTQFFLSGGSANAIAETIRSLSRRLSTGVLTWINTGLDLLSAGVTIALLVDDLGELHTSARYALGYETLPPLGPRIVADPADPVAHDPQPNPDLPADSCGLRVAVLLDRSTSIRNAGDEAMSQVRNAAVGLIDALGNTPSSVRISAFGTWPSTRVTWTSLTTAAGRQATRQAAQGIEFARGDNSGSTNWEAALSDVLGQDADLAVLVTDGNPTSFGSGMESSGASGGTFEFDPAALTAGVEAANVLKANGTRVVAVGVGEVNVDPLRQVSGPNEGSDYFLEDFASLGTSLAAVATDLCGAGLTVRHLVDGIPTGGAEYTFEVPDEDPQVLLTAADGAARLSLPEARDGVIVKGPFGLPLDGVVCDPGGTPVEVPVDDATGATTVDVEGAMTCTFTWRGLTGAEAALAELLERPGEVVVISFEPVPNAPGVVQGCLGSGADVLGGDEECAMAEFGVSFMDGFAVLRAAECESCWEPAVLAIAASPGGVRFQVDQTRLPIGSIGIDQVDLDLVVTAAGSAGATTVSGTVNDTHSLRVQLRQPPQPDTCLVRLLGESRPLLPFPENTTIQTGTGC